MYILYTYCTNYVQYTMYKLLYEVQSDLYKRTKVVASVMLISHSKHSSSSVYK